MAQITCWQCGERFSALEPACPRCGALSVNVLPMHEIEDLQERYGHRVFNPSDEDYDTDLDLQREEWF